MKMVVRPMTCADGITGRQIICDVCDRLSRACFTCEPENTTDVPDPSQYWEFEWICCSLTCANQAAVLTACGITAPADYPRTRLLKAGVNPDWTWATDD